jgi:hypothetical protein
MIFFPKSLCAATAFAMLLSSGSLSLAQTQADQLKVAYQAGRNQLGVMTYCSDKGHIGSDVVDIQKKLLGLIPAPADKSGGDEAEAQGKKGVISMMGMTQDIEAVSKMQNSTPAAFCKTMGDALKQAAAALPK